MLPTITKILTFLCNGFSETLPQPFPVIAIEARKFMPHMIDVELLVERSLGS
jgi:hypothetical protein